MTSYNIKSNILFIIFSLNLTLFLPVKPENLRGAFRDGSAGGDNSWPVVLSLA